MFLDEVFVYYSNDVMAEETKTFFVFEILAN